MDPIVEVDEAIRALRERGAAEHARITALPAQYQTQVRRLILRCRGKRCRLAVITQRHPRAPRLLCLHPKARIRVGRGWQSVPPLAMPADDDGPDIALRLHCRCAGTPNVEMTTHSLLRRAREAPGTHPVP